MGPLTGLCLLLMVPFSVAEADLGKCGAGDCKGTDETVLLQRRVGVEEAAAAAALDDDMGAFKSWKDVEGEVPDDDASESSDPECSTLTEEATCKSGGCMWTSAFDGEMLEDGSHEVEGYVCADHEEVEEEEQDKESANETGLMQVYQEQSSTDTEGRWCRRRRWQRRRGPCPYARRRRTPPAPTPAPAPDLGPRINLKGMLATQSSTAHGGSASRAIDGNEKSAWGGGSCTHTSTHTNPWWQVDLGSSQAISGIRITNRGDCCGQRLNGFSVLIDGKACATNVAISQGATKVLPCSGAGKVIRVQTKKRDVLTICELIVFGNTATTAAPTTAAPTTAAPTPAPTDAARATTVAPSAKVIFDNVDEDNNGGISRVELQKAIDAGTVVEGTAAPTAKPPSSGTTEPSTKSPGTVAPTAKPPSSGGLTQSQKDAIVQKHNALRAGLGASDMMKMVWDDALANAAQQYLAGVSLLAQESNASFQKCPQGHSQNRPNTVGENMAWKWSSSYQLADIVTTDFTPSVQSWYDEIKDAGPYKTGGQFGGFSKCTGVCGHYTQVVWAAANKIGCGAAFCPHSTGMGGYELVCQYGTSVPGGYGGNMGGATLFTQGAACSKCPSSFGTCSSKLCT